MNKFNFNNLLFLVIAALGGFAATVHAASVTSFYAATAPTINGVPASGEWDSTPSISVGNAFVHFRHNDTTLYLLVDQPDNKTLDLSGWPSDLVNLTFDVNRNSIITSNIDVLFGPYPVTYTLGKQYYLGANTWTGLNPTTATYATGFGTSFHSAVNHVIQEYAIPFSEINGALNRNVRFGIHIYSGTPSIDISNPANVESNFTNLVNVLLFKPDVVAASCGVAASTGDLAWDRGIRFVTDKSFNQFKVLLSASTTGWYHIKAVLRQSTGFTALALRTMEQDVYLTGSDSSVIFGFPLIEVQGSTYFTVAFPSITGPSLGVYMGTAGIGSYPCPDFIVTEENDVAVPTPRSSATGFALLTTTCYAVLPADINNNCKVDMADLAELSVEWLQCNLYPDYLCN